jgi:phosphoribosyl-AMP cyclohydrolase / phosphoribosyl-ATP pyrophosphohydrolase
MPVVEATINFTNLDTLNFSKGGGLLPAVIQHTETGAVLMLGYMNREALVVTLARRRVVFFSRSKARLWEKGETSGQYLDLEEIRADCDRDTLLVRAWPSGPVCHLGNGSCFGEAASHDSDRVGFLQTLEGVIEDRAAKRPQNSYTTKLLSSGWARVAQKVGEEGLEAAIAGAAGSDAEVVQEVADLLYHVLVLLKARGLRLEPVVAELRKRHEERAATPSAPPP